MDLLGLKAQYQLFNQQLIRNLFYMFFHSFKFLHAQFPLANFIKFNHHHHHLILSFEIKTHTF